MSSSSAMPPRSSPPTVATTPSNNTGGRRWGPPRRPRTSPPLGGVGGTTTDSNYGSTAPDQHFHHSQQPIVNDVPDWTQPLAPPHGSAVGNEGAFQVSGSATSSSQPLRFLSLSTGVNDHAAPPSSPHPVPQDGWGTAGATHSSDPRRQPHKIDIPAATDPATEPRPTPSPLAPPMDDFELIDQVEWGPSVDAKDYNVDQDLAPKPRRPHDQDRCRCQAPDDFYNDMLQEDGTFKTDRAHKPPCCCLDDGCLLFACQEECSDDCEAGLACGNNRIQNRQFKRTEVFDAGPKGRGLKVLEPCRRGDLVCEYTGEAVLQKSLDKLFRRYKHDRRLYIMALGDGVYLDARKKGSSARFINHSCDPNCRVERWKVKGVLRAAVMAVREIAPGEELSFDYMWGRKRGRAPTICHCGAVNCRGTIEEAKSMEEQHLQRHLEGHWEVGSSIHADQTLVNRVVQVYSEANKEYFLGEVTGFDPQNRLHCILYLQDMKEEWEDLGKEKWMVLEEQVAKDHFIIAKKILPRDAGTNSLLTAVAGQAISPAKHYLYIQTPIKEMLWSKHVIELCERNCSVQIRAEQMARPPLPVNMNDPEDVEKHRALSKSQDSTVWKLSINGSDVVGALALLEKNVAQLEKKLESERISSQYVSPSHLGGPPTTIVLRPQAAAITPGAAEVHDVIFPRLIVDAVKRKLAILRERCRNVIISFASSDSKSKQFSKLVIEGNLLSDVQNAKEVVWTLLESLCKESNAPMKANKVFRDLGFLGGSLTNDHFDLLCTGAKGRLNKDACENLESSPFIVSFEITYKCAVWVQSDEDKRSINTLSDKVDDESLDGWRQIYFGCHPKELARLWGLIQTRAKELARGVRYLYLGADRAYLPFMVRNYGAFFEFIKRTTGATVGVDPMTGDHVRIDGRMPDDSSSEFGDGAGRSAELDRASLAEELLRLQVELLRDHRIREHSWIFGRDWTLHGHSLSGAVSVDAKQLSGSFGRLDRKTVAQGGLDIAQTVALLDLDNTVAAHAAIILYRFVHASDSFETNMKLRDAILAAVYLANKTQKVSRRKALDAVLEAGYQVFYPGSKFDADNKEILIHGERVINAEKEILETLEYDIFWENVDWIVIAATGSGKMKREFISQVLDFCFSGQILSAGAELWLEYGVQYIFAVSAAFLKAKLDDLLPALHLMPLKVSKAADLLVENSRLGRPHVSKAPSHFLLEGAKDRLEKYLPRIKSDCDLCMRKELSVGSQGLATLAPEGQRYSIIAEQSRRRRVITGVARKVVTEVILPCIDGIAAESSCLVMIAEGQSGCEDIILEGPWRAIEIAEHLLRTKLGNSTVLYTSIDKTTDCRHQSEFPAKTRAGLVRANDIQTSDGWEGTIQSTNTNDFEACTRVGGKSCVAGKIGESSLREAGLRWWIPPNYGPCPSGAIEEMSVVRSDPTIEALAAIARSSVGKSNMFPVLSSKATAVVDGESDRFVPVSLQRWPPEKVEAREVKKASKSSELAKNLGFSPSALQELQLLKQLHSLVPSPQGHPNIILPVAIAQPRGDAEVATSVKRFEKSSEDEDPLFSLFRSNEENEQVAVKEKTVQACPHLVFNPFPFVLQRFLSSKMRAGEEPSISGTILAAWFHDLLSALVHCHSNHIVLRNIQTDQFVVDHSGVIKLGGFYRCTVIPPDERLKLPNPLKAARMASKKKSDDDDVSNNPYAAPEILLGSPKYSKASDVWAMGCMLAHLLLGKPLFIGKDRDKLLLSQFKVIGTPSKDNYEDATKFPHYVEAPKRYKRGVEKALEHMLKEAGSQHASAIDLVARMLHLDPAQRCTAAEALGHDMMTEYLEQVRQESYRHKYVQDWLALKRRVTGTSDKSKIEDLGRKRRAKMMAASQATGDDDDDLYDMADLLGEAPSKVPRWM